MTRKHAKELLPIITAFANGEEVQMRADENGIWMSCPEPIFNLIASSYRIAPKPRKVWVNEYPRGCFSAYSDHGAADRNSGIDRIACHELELPPLP